MPEEINKLYASLATPYLAAGESLVAFTPARRSPPFLLRIIPLAKLFLFPLYKGFLLICTSDRVQILTLKTYALKPQVKSVYASILLDQIASVIVRKGTITLQTKAGETHRFKEALFSDFDQFASVILHLTK